MVQLVVMRGRNTPSAWYSARYFLEYDFDELYQCGDDKDVGYGLEVAYLEWVEHEFLQQIGADGGYGHNEHYRCRHSDGGVGLFRYSEERAYSEELCQHYVVDKYGCDYYKEVAHSVFIVWLF